MGYKLLRKTKNDAQYRLMNYCYSKEYAIKLISLYQKRKIIRLGEKRSLMKTALWKIVPITRYETVMAQKDVPFWLMVRRAFLIYKENKGELKW